MNLKASQLFLAAVLLAAFLGTHPAVSQTGAPVPTSAPQTAPADDESAAAPAGDEPAFKPEELDQMLASIALYPDSLLTQVLMASTYPIEVVEADRWVKKNSSLKGDALAKELEKQTWDPSVRSLVNFPQVLAMMSENLSNTVKIGDAFIGQQEEVMDAVQRLRAKAKDTGNLKSGKEQNVKTETSEKGTEIIIIESTSKDTVYVPTYSPTVVYGSWPYPAYPPYPYYPPGYVASSVVSFGIGVACGAAWGYAWGNCNWGGGEVDIDIDRNTEFNSNINRESYKERETNRTANRETRQGDREGRQGDRQGNRQGGGQGKWQHDPSHRQGAAYRNKDAANKVGAGTASNRATQARNDYRGKAEAGRQDISRGGADAFKGNSPAARGGASPSNRAAPSKGGALNDSRAGGSSARSASQRGSSSRSSSPSASRSSSGSRSSAGSRSSGGGSRSSGGGGSRGGGGGRGGGGRR